MLYKDCNLTLSLLLLLASAGPKIRIFIHLESSPSAANFASASSSLLNMLSSGELLAAPLGIHDRADIMFGDL
jgi:hypothetical protein